MIKTKEDLILEYINSQEKLKVRMTNKQIVVNSEIEQAILDIGDPEVALWYVYYVLRRPEPKFEPVIRKNKEWWRYYKVAMRGYAGW